MPLSVGTVIRIPQRARAIYRITDINNGFYKIRRCRALAGYPDMGDRTTYRVPITQQGIVVVHSSSRQSQPQQQGSRSRSQLQTTTIDALEYSRWYPKCVTDCYRMLEARLSPENISCDGELTPEETEQARNKVLDLKKALDAYVERDVQLNV